MCTTPHIHAHMYMHAHAGLPWPGPWHLYSSVKLFEVDHVGWSPFVSRIVHKRLTYFGGHGASTYRSHSVRILFLFHTQFNSSPVVRFLENIVPLKTAVDLHSQFRWATVYTPCAKSATITSQHKMITSQVQFQIAKFKFRQYQNTTFFRHFTKFNARQIFPLYGIW